MAAALEQGTAWYLLAVYLHILATIFWVGHILFWTIMTGVLRRDLDDSRSTRILQLASESKWPPGLVPLSYRLRIPSLGWVFFFVLGVTGIFILFSQGNILHQVGSGQFFSGSQGMTMTAKLISVTGLAICQGLSTFRPDSRIPYLSMLLTILVVALSVLLVH